jgi:hypothetical protein
MFPTRSSLTSSGFTLDRSTGALPSSTAETSAKAPQKLPNRVLTLPSSWISSSVALSPRVFVLAQVVTSRPGRNDPRVPATKR